MTSGATPRVLMIAQWPSIKNAEYELIERVRRTGYKIAVVDFLGFDVQTGKCINDASLCDEYDFAVSLHYETPKFLNVPTVHWVANPLEFILAQGNYRTHLIHHLRSYDDFLYNGSDFLKEHIRAVVGDEWTDSGLGFFQSCSRNALIAPRRPEEGGETKSKLFYCGVNWEAISDKEGRAQGLLEILQQRQVADFYGPTSVLNVNVWGGFPSYRGEIPFDGESMFPAMHEYGAVLALSSPAHIKSRTSSGRVLEGFASGVPVISDENPHVRAQFGDLVHYFEGATEEARANSIQAALDEIRTHPEAAIARVREAQSLISREYCFEVCLERVRERLAGGRRPRTAPTAAICASANQSKVVDVFVFFHDPYAPDKPANAGFPNIPHVIRAMSSAAARDGVRFRLYSPACSELSEAKVAAPGGIEFLELADAAFEPRSWDRLRLGEKLSRLGALATGDYTVFLTQCDFPQHDYFSRALEWFAGRAQPGEPALHIAGFFVNDFSATAQMSAAGILRCSASNELYRWTQNSIAEHQLGQLCFNRGALRALDRARIERFDVLVALAAVLDCVSKGTAIHRSRFLLLRVQHGYYHRYLDAFRRASGKGLWAQHYDLLSNATHEINGLYDAFHQEAGVVPIADKILGIDIPPPAFATAPAPVDPAVLAVNHFLNQISPYVVRAQKIGRFFGIRR